MDRARCRCHPNGGREEPRTASCRSSVAPPANSRRLAECELNSAAGQNGGMPQANDAVAALLSEYAEL
jgi:hypothetical protein